MNNFNDNVNKRSQEILQKDIGKKGQALQSQQEAVSQLQAIQSERRNNLLNQRNEDLIRAQQTNTMAQAAMVGTSTSNVLKKYGMKSPPVVRSSQVKVVPNKITINNITNQVSSPQPTQVGSENPSKFKAWLSRTLAIQKEQDNKRNLEYEKREYRLVKSAKMMLRRVEEAGRDVAENLDPQRIGTSLGNQIKMLLMVFGLRFISKHWESIYPKIDNAIDILQEGFNKTRDFFRGTANYFGFTEKGKLMANKGGGFYNDLIRFLGGEPGKKGRSTLFEVGMTWMTQLGDYLEVKLKHMMKLRSEAIKSISFPAIDTGNIGVTLKGIAGYLGNILTALVDPHSALINNFNSKINASGMGNSMRHSVNTRHESFSHNVDVGESSIDRGFDKSGRVDYNLNPEYVDKMGNLKKTAAAQVNQSQDIIGAMHSAKTTGQIDTTRMAAGLQRLQDQAQNGNKVTVSPEFINLFYDKGTQTRLIKSGDISPKKYKFVKVKRTDAELADEEQAMGLVDGFITGYAHHAVKEALDVPVIAGDIVQQGINTTTTGKTTSMLMSILGDNTITRGTTGVINSIASAINKGMANDYTLKLVPAEDNTYGEAVKLNGKPYYLDLYTINNNALNELSRRNFGTNELNLKDLSTLKGISERLTQYGGGSAATRRRFENTKRAAEDMSFRYTLRRAAEKRGDYLTARALAPNSEDAGLNGMDYDTLDLSGYAEDINRYNQIEKQFQEEEDALMKTSMAYKFFENAKEGFNNFKEGSESMAEEAKRVILGTWNGGSEYLKEYMKNDLGGNGYWSSASIYGNPSQPNMRVDLIFSVKIATDTAIKNSSLRLYSPSGAALHSPYPSKSITKTIKHCAGYVRRAIAAGLSLTNENFYSRLTGGKSAKNYIDYLPGFGFKAQNWENYSPKNGDILVIGPVPGHPHGHICIKTSIGWISDFVQKDMWGDSSYRANKKGTVFRHIHVTYDDIDEDEKPQDALLPDEDYEDILFNENGDVIGYSTKSNKYISTTGEEMTETQKSSIDSRATYSEQFFNAQKWNEDYSNSYYGSSSASNNLVGQDEKKVASLIMKRLMDKLKISKEQAAGIVGNLMAESGLGVRSYNIGSIINDLGAPAAGLAQWRGDRLRKLQQYAKNKGEDWGDLMTQVDFISEELSNSERSTLTKVMNSGTAEEASRAFSNYERFANYNNPEGEYQQQLRANYSKQFLKDYTTNVGDVSYKSEEDNNTLKYISDSLKDGISDKTVACIGDSWMCGMLNISGSNVTKGDSKGISANKDNKNNYLFNELKKNGAKECIGLARSGAKLEHMISYVASVLASSPDIIIVHAGLNNKDDRKESLIKTILKIQATASNIPIFFCSINKVDAISEEEFNKLNQSLIESSVNILNISNINGLSIESDKLHPTSAGYKLLAERLVSELLKTAPNYNTKSITNSLNSDRDYLVYGNSEEDKESLVYVPKLIPLTTEEEKHYSKSKLVLSNLMEDSNTLREDLVKREKGYEQFSNWFSNLTDKQQRTYVLQKEAEKFWNSLDKNYRNFDFLPEGYKSFEDLFINLSDAKREELMKDMVEVVSYKKNNDKQIKNSLSIDELGALSLDTNVADNDDNNLQPGANKMGNGWANRTLSNRIVDKSDEVNFYNLLRSGKIDSARELVDKYIKSNSESINAFARANHPNRQEEFKKELSESVYGSFNQLASSLLAGNQFNSLTNEINKAYQDLGENISIKNIQKTKPSKDFNAELNAAKRFNNALDIEQLKFAQQYLTDGFTSTSEKYSDLKNLNILKSNAKIAEINKQLGKLKYYIDPESLAKGNTIGSKVDSDGKFVDKFGGVTPRYLEHMRAKVESGSLDETFNKLGIFSEKAVNKYIKDQYSENLKIFYQLEAQKRAEQKLMNGESKSEVNKWLSDVNKYINGGPERISGTINDYLRNHSKDLGLTLDNNGNPIFKTEADRIKNTHLAASKLMDSGSLNTFAYMQQSGLDSLVDSSGNKLITEEDFKTGNFKKSNLSVVDGKLKVEGNIDKSSKSFRDLMLREEALGHIMSDKDYYMKAPEKPKMSDFYKVKTFNQNIADLHNNPNLSYDLNNMLSKPGPMVELDKEEYDKAVEDWKRNQDIYDRVQEEKKGIGGERKRLAIEELNSRYTKENEELLKKAGETDFKTSVNTGRLGIDLRDDKSFDNYIKSKLGDSTLSDAQKALLRSNMINAGLGENDVITEVKTTLSNGDVITRLVDPKGNTIHVIVPDEVAKKRTKGFDDDKLWKKLGFNSKEAQQRQEETETAAVAYRNRLLDLQQKGLTAQDVIQGAQQLNFARISQILDLATGKDGGINVKVSNAPEPSEKESDQTSN